MGCVAMQEIHQARKSEHAPGIFHHSTCHETPKDNWKHPSVYQTDATTSYFLNLFQPRQRYQK